MFRHFTNNSMLLYAVYTLYKPIKYNIYKHNTQICFSVVIAFACIIASFFGGANSFKSTIITCITKDAACTCGVCTDLFTNNQTMLCLVSLILWNASLTFITNTCKKKKSTYLQSLWIGTKLCHKHWDNLLKNIYYYIYVYIYINHFHTINIEMDILLKYLSGLSSVIYILWWIFLA